MNEANSGLEGVVVADTRLSHVDGARGRLVIAGHDVEHLAGEATFEEIAALLWTGVWPTADVRAQVQGALAAGRVDAWSRLDRAGAALSLPDPMDALRAFAAQQPTPPSDERQAAARMTGALAVGLAAWLRARSGAPPIAPDPALAHAADLLRMASGRLAPPAAVAALDAYAVTVADHGLNASTFAARVVASTGSDVVSAVTAAIGALKGPLHGGAPGPVLDMLDAVETPERARTWLAAELAAGRRIMGMGHRVYRVRDPRAAVLERAIGRLEQAAVAPSRLSLARAVERAAEELLAELHPDRPLRANVEFYTAVLLDAIGLARESFPAVFACARVVGWCAHVAEQRRTGRLIRPSSRYVGTMP